MAVKTPIRNKKPVSKTTTLKIKILKFLWKSLLWFFGITVLLVLVFKWIPVPVTPLMIFRAYEERPVGKPEYELKHDWVPIEEMSRNVQKAVIASEDGNFLKHHGFDFRAMQLAFKNNSKGKKLKGGSTISQQTAKNVFLWQGRSYLRKALEAYFTFLIEIIWGKERIMEVYLNSIEMGDGVFGVEAATQFWYRKSCKTLTKREAAGIAAILPNPRKYKANHSTTYIENRKTKIVKRMGQIGSLDY
jgi:monofunctional glycosyltransferase